MKDFSLEIYAQLLGALSAAEYSFQTFQEYLKAPQQKVVILRHDVDSWPSMRYSWQKQKHLAILKQLIILGNQN